MALQGLTSVMCYILRTHLKKLNRRIVEEVRGGRETQKSEIRFLL